MLHEKNLPKQFWAEAANTAVFLQNRLPTRAVRDKTPFEVWYGYEPSLNFLKIFGCLCFTHVPQTQRDKLDKRALPGIFIGYSSVAKAYKVFQPQNGKIIISRDVHFMEDEEWNWDDAKKKDSTSKENSSYLFWTQQMKALKIGRMKWTKWWMIDLLEAQEHFMIFTKDAMLLCVNLQIMKKPRPIRIGLLQ